VNTTDSHLSFLHFSSRAKQQQTRLGKRQQRPKKIHTQRAVQMSILEAELTSAGNPLAALVTLSPQSERERVQMIAVEAGAKARGRYRVLRRERHFDELPSRRLTFINGAFIILSTDVIRARSSKVGRPAARVSEHYALHARNQKSYSSENAASAAGGGQFVH
jgi:hypothetical protein